MFEPSHLKCTACGNEDTETDGLLGTDKFGFYDWYICNNCGSNDVESEPIDRKEGE